MGKKSAFVVTTQMLNAAIVIIGATLVIFSVGRQVTLAREYVDVPLPGASAAGGFIGLLLGGALVFMGVFAIRWLLKGNRVGALLTAGSYLALWWPLSFAMSTLPRDYDVRFGFLLPSLLCALAAVTGVLTFFVLAPTRTHRRDLDSSVPASGSHLSRGGKP